MKCNCANLPEVFYFDAGPAGFQDGWKEIDAQKWMRLFECAECGTLWAIDEWDKYYFQAVSRIDSRDGWPAPLPDEKRKKLLLQQRGGTTNEACIWKDCEKKRVKGVVYCIDHLYKTGTRK